MALDDILGKLTVQKDGKRTPNPEYKPKFLADAVIKVGELSRANLETLKGLEAYAAITGEKPGKYALEQLQLRRKAKVEVGSEEFTRYGATHFGSIVKEMDEGTQIAYSLKYCPTKDSEDKDNPYNSVRKNVRELLDKVAKIENNPSEFFAEEMKKESPLMARYMLRYASEFVEIEKIIAERTAQRVVQKYGAGKFLTDSMKVIDKQASKLENAAEDLSGILEEAEKKAGRGVLSAEERAKAVNKKQEEYLKMVQANPDAEMRDDLIKDAITYSVSRYIQKEAQEKAKKEEQEKAKKEEQEKAKEGKK